MTLALVRDHCYPDRVEGHLSLDGVYACLTLEPPRRADNPLIEYPAIPAGTYGVTIAYSPRFQQMVPHVNNVPGRQNIEIHVGNVVPDTHGCILVGEERLGRGILHSRDALDALMAALARELSQQHQVTLEIDDPVTGELAA